MNNYEDAIKYIEQQEATKISFVKVGDDNRKLIVCFASNSHNGFARKTSLMKLKYERKDFDVLYLRNQYKWYMGGLTGIGKNINHTISFLKKEFAKYDLVICHGGSAGGYASLVFGQLCNVDLTFSVVPQTDLEYVMDNLPVKELANQKQKCRATWEKYKKIRHILERPSKSTHFVTFPGDKAFESDKHNLILHGDYHYMCISQISNVIKTSVDFILFANDSLDKL